jgi:ubiquinone/menaquinone biosynthesis C-methylase UbiE
MIQNLMKGFGGLFDHDLVIKVVCFDVDGVVAFQGIKTRVATQLKQTSSPFCIHVHCVVHKTNLAAFTFSNLPIVVKIEALLANVYTYFSHTLKNNSERSKLVEVMETKGFKILRNIKTRWLFQAR